MIVEWMIYVNAISCVLSGAGLVLEQAFRLNRWPTRTVWVAVLFAPLLFVVITLSFGLAPSVSVHRPTMSQSQIVPASRIEARGWAPVPRYERNVARLQDSPTLARWVTGAWVLTSTILALILVAAWMRLQRKMRRWTWREVDGTQLLVSDDVGPAAVGLFRSRIVVPEWLLAAEDLVCRLAIAHERSHVHARDPLLLFSAAVLIVLLPWNLPLWWQWHRLRFAIEADCDARVLGGGADAGSYGEALLHVAERRSQALLLSASMREPVSTLEKRVRLVLLNESKSKKYPATAFLLLGVTVAVAAAQIDAPPRRVDVTSTNAPAQVANSTRPSGAAGALGRALVRAIADGDSDAATSLIGAGADVNFILFGDGTPLIVAVRRGNLRLVQILLQRGARVDLAVPRDGNPLIAAASGGSLELVSTLVSAGSDVNGIVMGDETPLINASRAGHLEIVRYLVEHGADLNLAVPAGEGSTEIRSPLGEAVKHRRGVVAQYLREHGAR